MKKRRLRRKKPNRSLVGDSTNIIILAIFGVFMILPMVYTISNAFKPLDEIFLYPPRFFVMNPTMDNFYDLIVLMNSSWVPFTRYIFNTFLLTTLGTAGHVIFASAAAYALAKHNFPGKRLFFGTVVTALMFSPAVTAIPNYLTMAKLGWIDTYLSLIVPAFAYPLGLYLMKQFMEGLPDSLLESARIDGAGEISIYWKIAMPNVKPAWLTLIIFSFQNLWGQTGGNFIYSEELKPLPFALNQLLAGGIARAGVGAAVGLLMMIVPVTVFIITQSNVLETMSTSGMKDQ